MPGACKEGGTRSLSLAARWGGDWCERCDPLLSRLEAGDAREGEETRSLSLAARWGGDWCERCDPLLSRVKAGDSRDEREPPPLLAGLWAGRCRSRLDGPTGRYKGRALLLSRLKAGERHFWRGFRPVQLRDSLDYAHSSGIRER